MKYLFLCSAALLAQPAFADTTVSAAISADSVKPDDDDRAPPEIVVSARRLDASRDRIDPAIGANDFAITRSNLDLQPGGADRNLKGVLLQAPGISQDSDGDGDIHIRNEHGNIQYRLNGITVPQGFGGFGALVDPRIADSIEVLTGALPAQYGFRTAGVINLKTRKGSFDFDGDVGIYGGSRNSFLPSVTLRNSSGALNYFFSGSYQRNDLGISNPTPSLNAIHDTTKQWRGFGYLSYLTGENSRITAFGGTSIGSFQIPNAPGLTPNYILNGRSTFDSAKLDQNQRQVSHFGVIAWQHSDDNLDIQVAPFIRYAKAHYTPDPSGGQLIFNGVDTDLTQASLAYGAQADASIKVSDNHRLRFGGFVQHETTQTDTINRVFPIKETLDPITLLPVTVQTSDVPIIIPVHQGETGTTLGLYVQDEWTISDTWTFNYGLRFDQFDGILNEKQLSPRAGLVWKPSERTTVHAGYARNFTPPPLELISTGTISAFDGTTAETQVKLAGPVHSEREHSFDIGMQQFLTDRLSLTIDAYYKIKSQLLDEEHFGSTLIESPFNYAKAYGWGIEAGLDYESEPFRAYANVARGEQKAKQINSNQFFFDQQELDYISNHYIFTDHSQTWTASAGAALKLKNRLGEFQPGLDLIYGSGLRAGDPTGIVPNGGKQDGYVQVNLGLAQRFGGEEHGFTVRLDVVNLFDKHYLIHDGSGVGAGQPEYGPRRGIFLGLRKSF